MHLDESLPNQAQLLDATESVFVRDGLSVDSVLLAPGRTLVVVLSPGVLVRPVRMEHGKCAGGETAWAVLHKLASTMDHLYARAMDAQAITVRAQSLAARESGWGWSVACRTGGGSVTLGRRELDSLQPAAN